MKKLRSVLVIRCRAGRYRKMTGDEDYEDVDEEEEDEDEDEDEDSLLGYGSEGANIIFF